MKYSLYYIDRQSIIDYLTYTYSIYLHTLLWFKNSLAEPKCSSSLWIIRCWWQRGNFEIIDSLHWKNHQHKVINITVWNTCRTTKQTRVSKSLGPIKNEKKTFNDKTSGFDINRNSSGKSSWSNIFCPRPTNHFQYKKASNFKSRYSKLTKIVAIDFDKQQKHKKQSGIKYLYQKF